ncbi:MAG: bifunctional UDP-sugar hydrolase/5'-nucleotidase UshA [Aquincola sp.]|nr:bifunctional UDP-sugar hydrolase/5'-nucleotidase UshA [Aquincola sp.]MDH4288464.1 bifunctional UDP-sugar hydrolase/5'-nucleotidase UshA [Aquincola sp.]
MTMTRRLWIPLAAAALLAGCALTPAERAPLKLTVLHTNDHHGRFWPNADGEYGLAARKTLIDRIRTEVAAAGGHVLLLDGGDVNTGVPESDLQDAEPDFKGMNLLGYDAIAVGNHEFDKPLAVLEKQRQWAKFPLLAANIYRGTQRLFEPYRIFERGGYRIAVVGLTTEDTKKMVLPENVAGIDFRKPADEAAKLVPDLRGKADMVIAATHMGHYADGRSGVNAPGDVEMARAVKGLDLIVGGHSQNPVCMTGENKRNDAYVPGQPCAPDRQNGAWIVQAHEWGKYVGRADFVIAGGKVELVKYQLLPVNLKQRQADNTKKVYTEQIPEDAAVREFLKPFQDNGAARLTLPVGETVGVFDGERNRVRSQPTNLGVMIARSMQERTGADLAIMNAGGVRDSLPDGKITYRDVLKVQPFANQISLVRLSGAELLKYLEAVAKMTPGSGAFPQTVGVQMVIEGGALREAKVNGQPIDARREYRLAINNFTAGGGDGYPKLSDHPGHVNTGFNDADVMRAFIAARSPIRAADFAPASDVVRR